MNKAGPVIVIEDDLDDQEILKEIFRKFGYENKICFFEDGQAALDYLNETHIIPFLILSDINMPKMDGFATRSKFRMDASLQLKCVPYLFFTTSSSQRTVIEAYGMSVQGFFVKPNSMKEMEVTIGAIMQYWQLCSSPNIITEDKQYSLKL